MTSFRRLLDRHRGINRPLVAMASLALLAGLIVLGLSNPVTPPPPVAAGAGDIALYNTIVADMRGGVPYYEAAVDGARKGHYPLRPFVTVRLPTLAWLLSKMPDEKFGRAGLAVLAAITLGAWAWRLSAAQMTKPRYALALICLASGVTPAFLPAAVAMHEVWAGLLIALSLALRRNDAWIASVLIGIAAALIRELAGAYLLAMAVMALQDRNYREAAAWMSGIAVLALALAAHAVNVNALVTAADLTSPGWFQIGGWRFVLQTAQWNVFLSAAPHWLTALAVPLALFGLTAAPMDRRLLLVVGGYVMAFIVVGRDDNFYWGLLIAPLWPLGLAAAGPALIARLSDSLSLLRRTVPEPLRSPR
ncbi:hypothetical protein BH10PSE11_BH10PSE11_36150 [soil metagenome]